MHPVSNYYKSMRHLLTKRTMQNVLLQNKLYFLIVVENKQACEIYDDTTATEEVNDEAEKRQRKFLRRKSVPEDFLSGNIP